MAYAISSAIFQMAASRISKRVKRRSSCSITSRIAGPEQNAEARNCGARIDEFQYGRAASPLYRNAVTVWIPTAIGTESSTSGTTSFLMYGLPLKARYRMWVATTKFTRKYRLSTDRKSVG